MLYNEVRPHSFDAMVGQENIVKIIQKQAINKSLMNLYILGGQFGSGKTTMARIIALAANCEHPDENGNPCLECEHCKALLTGNSIDYMEIDGASKTGVDDIRSVIDDVSYSPTFLNKKIYIIDEVHMLSKSAFNSLLKTLEEPPAYAIFILCTTELKAIPLTVQSRAAKFIFAQISDEDIARHLKKVSADHGIMIDDNAIRLIAKNSSGAMRNALSLLEQASIKEGTVTECDIQQMLGIADVSSVYELLKQIIQGNTAVAVKSLDDLLSNGKDMIYLIDDILDILSDAIILSCSKDSSLIGNTTAYKKMLEELVVLGDRSLLCHLSEQFMALRTDIRKNPSRTTMVVNLVRITGSAPENNMADLVKRISSLENIVRALSNGQSIVAPETVSIESVEPEAEKTSEESVQADSTVCKETETCASDQEDEQKKQEEDWREVSNSIPFEQDKKPDQKMSAEETSLESDFMSMENIFGDFMNFDMNPASPPVSVTSADTDLPEQQTEESDETSEVISSSAQGIIDAVDQIIAEDMAFASAVTEGCKRVVSGDTVKYITPLQPVYMLLKSYFDAYALSATVELDVNMVI